MGDDAVAREDLCVARLLSQRSHAGREREQQGGGVSLHECGLEQGKSFVRESAVKVEKGEAYRGDVFGCSPLLDFASYARRVVGLSGLGVAGTQEAQPRECSVRERGPTFEGGHGGLEPSCGCLQVTV